MSFIHLIRAPALALALAAAVLASAARAQGSGSCSQPSLDQCKDVDYAQTYCGQQYSSFCYELVSTHWRQYLSTLPPERPVQLPDYMGGGTVQSRPVPYDASHDFNFSSGTYVGLLERSQVIARKPATALSSEEQWLVQQKAQWETNGQDISSCEEYVYEKNLDLSRWQDRAGAFPGDHRAIFDDAYGPAGIANHPLYRRDGLPVEIAWPESAPKNAYFQFSPGPYPSGYAPYSFDPHLLDQIERGREHGAQHPSFAWHASMNSALAEVPDSDLAAADARQQTFVQLLDQRQRTWDAYVRGLTPVSPPDPEAAERTAEALRSLDAQIDDALRRAYDEGCLESEAVSRCDWSPQLFHRQLTEATLLGQERDYQRCVALTGNDFSAVGVVHDAIANGVPGAGQPDYSHQLADFGLLLDLLDAPVNPENIPEVKKPGYRGFSKHLGNHGGNWFLSGSYDGDISWGVKDYQGPLDNLCHANLWASTNFRATVTLLNLQTWEVIYGRGNAETTAQNQVHVEAVLRIAGNDLFQPINQTINVQYDTGPRSESVNGNIIGWNPGFDFGIAKASLTFMVGGAAGLDYSLAGGIERDCVHKYVGAGVTGSARPWGSLDVTVGGYAELFWGLVKGGIQGQVILVRLDLPVDAHLGLYSVAWDNNLGIRLNASCSAKLDVEALSGNIKASGLLDFLNGNDGYVYKWTGFKERVTLYNGPPYDVQLAALR